MSLPVVRDLISFAVFFLPGFLSMLVFSLLSGIEVRRWSFSKVTFMCAVLSVFSFLFAGIALDPQEISASIFAPFSFLTVLGISTLIGTSITLLSISWLYLSKCLALLAQKVSRRTHIPYASYDENCLTNLLKGTLKSSPTTFVTIHVSCDHAFRGFLGGYGKDPDEVVLMARQGRPIQKLERGHWVEIDDCLLVVQRKDAVAVSFGGGE